MQDEAVVLDGGRLAERLSRQMFGRALLGTKRDEPDVIGKAGFFERPSHTEGAHQGRCEIGDPFVSGERDHTRSPLLSAIARFSK